MTPLLRITASLLLAVAYTLSAVSPCPPVLEASARAPYSSAKAAQLAAPDADGAAEPQTSIAAACPCGCEKKSPVRGGGSAGFALSRPTPEPAFQPTAFTVAAASPARPAAPDAGIDPVPI